MIKLKIGTFDLGYRVCVAVQVGPKRHAWCSPKLPLPLSVASLKHLWRHRHAH